MKITEIDENLNYAFASVLVWVNCLKSPIDTSRSLVDQSLSDGQKVKQVGRIWVVSVVIGQVFNIPIYSLLGVDWERISFSAPAIIALILTFFAIVATIEIGFRLYRIPSNFVDTLVIYSVTVGAYAPLISLLTLPHYYAFVETLKAIKGPGLGFTEVFQKFFEKSPQRNSPFVDTWDLITHPILFALEVACNVLLAYCAAMVYKARRPKILESIAVSWCVLMPISVGGLLLLSYWILYAAV